MSKMTLVVAEKDINMRQEWFNLAKEWNVHLVDCFASSKRLIEFIRHNKPDTLWMNLDSFLQDGVEICNSMWSQGLLPQTVWFGSQFSLSHYEASYRMGILDILPLTLNRHRLDMVVEKIARNLTINTIVEAAVSLVSVSDIKLIKYKQRYKDCLVNEDQLLFAEKTSDKLTRIVLKNEQIIETSSCLKDLHLQCSPLIAVPHRSFLVNLRYVEKIVPDITTEGNYEISLRSGKYIVPLTRKYCHSIFRQFPTVSAPFTP